MKIFTIGFTQKSAREFFNKIKENKIETVTIKSVYGAGYKIEFEK